MESAQSTSTGPESVPVSPLERVAVIGAGVMGRSIALANLRRGLPVALHDNQPETLRTAAEWIAAELDHETSDTPAALRIVHSIGELGDVSVVIEAIVENLAVKRRLFAAITAGIPDTALLVTNTSSLSIMALAEGVRLPERFCGLHFCHPVALRPLVEVTAAPETSAGSLECARRYVQMLGKRPLITADVPGFAVNRLLFPYLEAAVDLARHGVPFDVIESAATAFGMPMGPLAQLDDIGIDVILRAAAGMHRGNFGIPATSEPLLALYQAGRMGRKTGAGFFRYDDEGIPRDDATSVALIGARPSGPIPVSTDELLVRLFLPMLVAAADILARRVVNSVGEIRIALLDGLGFDPQKQDLLEWGAQRSASIRSSWLDRLSLAARADEVERLLEQSGSSLQETDSLSTATSTP